MFQASVHQGDAGAQFLVGEMRLKGTGLDNDYQKARIGFKKSAEQGYPDAQFCLEQWYAESKGGARNLKLAYVLLTLAETNGI